MVKEKEGVITGIRESFLLRNIFEKDIPLAAEVARRYGLDLRTTEQFASAGQRLVKAKAS